MNEMEKIDLKISEQEFADLNLRYPNHGKSSVISGRADELVKMHFRNQNNNCVFEKLSNGGDLRITSIDEVLEIEIKGTAETGINWQRLKVSGKPSYRLLINGLPLYRVCGVYERFPVIYILHFCRDFDMRTEPRW
ncbi:unnamed protein product, partial [marine sediment metagenome]